MRGLVLGLLLLGCGYPDYRYEDDAAAVVADSGDLDSFPVDGPEGESGCPKPNGCGGCEDQGVKGARCEPCGQWTCDDDKVVCTPASPSPGSACEMCGTSMLTCTAVGTAACVLEDDRTVYDDANFKSRGDRIVVVDRTREALITFKSVRSMAYVDVSTAMKRLPYVCSHIDALPHPDSACSDCKPALGGGFDCTVPSPTGGFITMTLYSGQPPALVPLATASAPASMVFDSKTEWVTLPFAAPVSARPPGTLLSIGITSDSTGYALEVYGAGAAAFPPAASDTKWWQRTLKPTGSWIEQPSNDIAHVLRGKACAP